MSARKVNEFEISGPCSASWNEMKGDDRLRYCDHCEKTVNNISKMKRKDALRLVRRSNGNICIRYHLNPKDGGPLFARGLHQLVDRSAVKAGVLTASLALSGGVYAQGDAAQSAIVQPANEAKTSDSHGSIKGVVTDQNGAVIPFALISLQNEQTSEYRTTSASNEGSYEFSELAQGSYKLKIEAGGFEAREIATVFVGAGDSVNRDAQLGLQQIAAVVEVGGDVSVDTSVVMGGMEFSTVYLKRNELVIAVQDEDLDEVKSLLTMGARVNSRDKGFDGITPLHAAVETGNFEIIQYLLNNRAKVNIRDHKKRTPLMMMDEDASTETIDLLIRYGVKVDLTDKAGNTALHHLAVYGGRDELIRFLITHGIDVNAVNKRGQTALMIAAENESASNVSALLESGADVNRADRSGKTALDICGDDVEVRQLLASFGAVGRLR
jgi:hypothetical protein